MNYRLREPSKITAEWEVTKKGHGWLESCRGVEEANRSEEQQMRHCQAPEKPR